MVPLVEEICRAHWHWCLNAVGLLLRPMSSASGYPCEWGAAK